MKEAVLFSYFVTVPYADSRKQPIFFRLFPGVGTRQRMYKEPLRNNQCMLESFVMIPYAALTTQVILYFYSGF